LVVLSVPSRSHCSRPPLPSFPTRRSSDLNDAVHSAVHSAAKSRMLKDLLRMTHQVAPSSHRNVIAFDFNDVRRRHDDHHRIYERSEEHTSELQSREKLVCRLLREKKNGVT